MTLIELIADGLDRNGYDGLYRADVCACKRDDLAPCGCLAEGCEPGVLVDVECCDNCTPSEPCGFHIGSKGKEVTL